MKKKVIIGWFTVATGSELIFWAVNLKFSLSVTLFSITLYVITTPITIINTAIKVPMKFYKNNEEQYAVLYFYNNQFGVCGTGRTAENITLNNGKQATIGLKYVGNPSQVSVENVKLSIILKIVYISSWFKIYSLIVIKSLYRKEW